MKVVAEKLTRRYDFLEFHIVGRGGTDDSEAEMHRWAEENPRCLYYWVSMENMAELYRKADIVLIPTRGERRALLLHALRLWLVESR